MKRFCVIYTLSIVVVLSSSCAKKYDWTCTCEIYTTTNSFVKTKDITNKSQSDANEDCAKFGETEAGVGGSHDCTTKVN